MICTKAANDAAKMSKGRHDSVEVKALHFNGDVSAGLGNEPGIFVIVFSYFL